MQLQKQRHRDDQEVHAETDQKVNAQSYKFMLHNLMALIQEYLLLSDDDTQRGSLTSLAPVGSTPQLRENNRICIWLDDL